MRRGRGYRWNVVKKAGGAKPEGCCTGGAGAPPHALAALAAALSDPLRLQILDLLATGRSGPCCSPVNPQLPVAVCACDISADLGGLAPSKLAYHLARLREAELLLEQRKGKWVYYSLNRPVVAKVLELIASRWLPKSAGEESKVSGAELPRIKTPLTAGARSVRRGRGSQ
jgi:ArsR family transcriptional regulator